MAEGEDSEAPSPEDGVVPQENLGVNPQSRTDISPKSILETGDSSASKDAQSQPDNTTPSLVNEQTVAEQAEPSQAAAEEERAAAAAAANKAAEEERAAAAAANKAAEEERAAAAAADRAAAAAANKAAEEERAAAAAAANKAAEEERAAAAAAAANKAAEEERAAAANKAAEEERAAAANKAAEEERAAAAAADRAAERKPISDTTKIIGKEASFDSTPLAPKFGVISEAKITKIHSLGDLHGWAPGLISYLIVKKLAQISIDGYPMQDAHGQIHKKNMNEAFPDPTLNFPSLPKAGLTDQPHSNRHGVNNGGHGAIKARWIAQPHVALVQVGDIFDRADHSELAAEIMRQLIIDAPGRVFALVGNHEQFMLENDFQNWAHNEVRSAYVDDVKPKPGTKAHYRFFSQVTPQQKMMEEVFERYKISTWTLFLTQGAVFEKLGWANSNPSWKLDQMLTSGWEPYIHAGLHMNDHKQGKEIPGALTALVLNDVLFHHGEPAAHKEEANGSRLNLHASISRVLQTKSFEDLRVQMYRHGGYSLQSSPDQPLLWARGSSSGANTGLPAAEQHLSALATKWKGLHRIVHGHTPTVSASEFREQTNGHSTTVSYLADSTSSESYKGRANKIRVHNIDEGMSPVYFNHAVDDAYDPCRVPVGLRIENDEFSAVEAAKPDSKLVELGPKSSMDEDRRNLWKWSPGQWRTNANETWELHKKIHCKPIQFKDWRGFIFVQDGLSSKKVMETLQRRVMGPTVLDLLIEQVLHSMDPTIHIQTLPAMLDRVQPIGKDLFQKQPYRAFEESKIAILISRPNNENMELCAYNGFNHSQIFEYGHKNYKGSFKATPWDIASNAGESRIIKNPSFVFIGLDKTTQSAYGVNEDDKTASRTRISPSIGYKFPGNAEKMTFLKAKEITLKGKPKSAAKNWLRNDPKLEKRKGPSGSLGSQGSQNGDVKTGSLKHQSKHSNRNKKDLASLGTEFAAEATSDNGVDKGKGKVKPALSQKSYRSSGTTTSSGSSLRRNNSLRDQGKQDAEDYETPAEKDARITRGRRTGFEIGDRQSLLNSFVNAPGEFSKKGSLKIQQDGRDFCKIIFIYQSKSKMLILRVKHNSWDRGKEIDLMTMSDTQEVLSWPERVPTIDRGVAPLKAFEEFWDDLSKKKDIIINLASTLIKISQVE